LLNIEFVPLFIVPLQTPGGPYGVNPGIEFIHEMEIWKDSYSEEVL